MPHSIHFWILSDSVSDFRNYNEALEKLSYLFIIAFNKLYWKHDSKILGREALDTLIFGKISESRNDGKNLLHFTPKRNYIIFSSVQRLVRRRIIWVQQHIKIVCDSFQDDITKIHLGKFIQLYFAWKIQKTVHNLSSNDSYTNLNSDKFTAVSIC